MLNRIRICLLVIDTEGACTMLVTESDYNTETNKYLSNTDLFNKIDKNPIEHLVKIETNFMNKLKTYPNVKALIPAFEPNTLTIAKFYGTIKHHKPSKSKLLLVRLDIHLGKCSIKF